jgi:hypothetical protein
MQTQLEELEELGIRLKKRKTYSEVIIKTFMPEEYSKIPRARIHAFVSDIISQQDKMALDSWMAHFETVKVPYRITEGIKPSIRPRDRIRIQTMLAERKA